MSVETSAALTSETAVRGVELTVVVPTLNEADNIRPVVELLDSVLSGISWEVLFVDDDSTDGTVDRIREIARTDGRVRVLHRIGRRGLSSACIEGALASTAPYIAVTDADLQHDVTLLAAMLQVLKTEPVDIVVGSRYIEGGSADSFSQFRGKVSRIATALGKHLIKGDVTDPMSGFFMVRRDAFDAAVRHLSGIGFKILLDLFASYPGALRFKELPYQFRSRMHGESKLDSRVVWEYLMLIADKRTGGMLPLRFIMFCLVGTFGLGVHLGTLGVAHRVLQLDFATAQAAATIIAMVSNYTLNNMFTYRDRRLKGWGFVKGLASFFLVCGIGGIANVGIAQQLFQREGSWWLSGVAGALVSSVWNYVASSVFTWRGKAR